MKLTTDGAVSRVKMLWRKSILSDSDVNKSCRPTFDRYISTVPNRIILRSSISARSEQICRCIEASGASPNQSFATQHANDTVRENKFHRTVTLISEKSINVEWSSLVTMVRVVNRLLNLLIGFGAYSNGKPEFLGTSFIAWTKSHYSLTFQIN